MPALAFFVIFGAIFHVYCAAAQGEDAAAGRRDVDGDSPGRAVRAGAGDARVGAEAAAHLQAERRQRARYAGALQQGRYSVMS